MIEINEIPYTLGGVISYIDVCNGIKYLIISQRNKLNDSERLLLKRYQNLRFFWELLENSSSEGFRDFYWDYMCKLSDEIGKGFVTSKCDYCKKTKDNVYIHRDRMCHDCWVFKEFRRKKLK